MKKYILVTGANRGIGLECSVQLAKQGHKVYMGMRNPDEFNEKFSELKQQDLDLELIKLDVTKTVDIRAFSDLIKNEGNGLDVLINNAGVWLEPSSDNGGDSYLNADSVIILKSIETNTMGALKLSQSLVPFMIEKGEGRIINVSSGMGGLTEMQGGYPGYRMSKAALNVLTKISSAELAGKNISVNSVCPGWCRTDMGGRNATRSAAEGAETIVWLATCENPPKGQFLRDKESIAW